MFNPNNPFDLETAVDEALSLVTSGYLNQGEAAIRELLKYHPYSPSTHFAMGVVHAVKEKHDAAINCFDTAIEMDPNNVEAYFNRAVAYKEKLDPGNMIQSFQEVVRRGQPDDELVFHARRFLDDMEKSIRQQYQADLTTYIAGREIFDRAFSLMEKKEWEKALEIFYQCVQKIKNHHQSYGNMGICFAMLGQKTKALEALDQALKIDPSYELARANRILVEQLEEGERLPDTEFRSADYSKETFLRDREKR